MSEPHFGKCYEFSYKYAMENHDWKIVHGTITNRYEPFQTIYHAWCILGDVVHDVATGKDYPIIVYKAIFDAKADKTYSFEEAKAMAVIYEHYGMWEAPTVIADQEKYYDEDGNLKKEHMGEGYHGKSKKGR